MSSLRGWPSLLGVIAIGCGTRSLDPRDGAGPDARDARVLEIIESPRCGDGITDAERGEECDDGNTVSGDGCTAICQIECLWSCHSCGFPGPCDVTHVIGDGWLDGPEVCDDGNGSDGDGCSGDDLTIEAGWRCPVTGRRCVPNCGDGRVVGPEMCDDGNTSAGDGCSDICLTEPSGARCGDGVVWGAEECDDGPTNSDEEFASCTTRCKFGPYCGDGVVNTWEYCDLGPGKNTAGYGDRAGCAIECSPAPYCGDAVVHVDQGEQCDLGAANGLAGQPCSTDCRIIFQ